MLIFYFKIGAKLKIARLLQLLVELEHKKKGEALLPRPLS
jgi:hypothetical protein